MLVYVGAYIVISYFFPVLLIWCLVYAKNVTVGRNDINCGLCERALQLGCAGNSEEQFSFYTKTRIFEYTCTICDKTMGRGRIFLQINNGFEQIGDALNASLVTVR